jgi:hypothetical protein
MNINKYFGSSFQRMNNDFLSQHFSISTSISQISALMDFFPMQRTCIFTSFA